MNHFAQPTSREAIIAMIADTFDVPADSITPRTEPGEVPGWDSLGHSVLLTRLTRRFGLPVTEELAVPVNTVEELIFRISKAMGPVQGGIPND